MKTFQKSAVLFVILLGLISLIAVGCSKYDDKLDGELIRAVGKKDVQQVKDLIARNANPNVVDSQGNPMLSKVITEMEISLAEMQSGTITNDQSAEMKEIVKVLIEAGADINIKNNKGTSVLMAALARGDLEIIDLLISEGAEINDKDTLGTTVLMTAIYASNDKAAKTLIEKGADINEVENDGANALFIAIYRNRPEIAELLINKDADVNLKLKVGTPILFAAANGDLKIVKLLTEKGADINAKDDHGISPLSIARTRNYNDVVEFLVKSGAKE